MASTWSELKAEGNKAYSEGDLDTAVAKYTAALQTDVAPLDRATLLCNRAQCFLKQDKFSEAIEDCTACLAVAPENVKALFRRAVAYEQSGKKEEAGQDYDAVLGHNPTIQDAVAGFKRCTGREWRLPPSEKKSGGGRRQLTAEDMAAISEVEGRVKEVARQKRQAQDKLMSAQREKRGAELMAKVLSETPADQKVYRSVGKVFMARPRPQVQTWLDARLSSCDSRMKVCTSTLEYLKKQEGEADAAFLELIKGFNGGRMPARG